MKAIEFYGQFLQSLGVEVDTTYETLGMKLPGSPTPITANKKTLVLPTDKVLAEYNTMAKDIQVFHPACENVLRKDSEVFNFLKRLVRVSLTMDLQSISLDMLKVAMTPEYTEKATKAQRKILAKLPEVDQKAYENLESIFDKNDVNGENKFINITVERGQEIAGVKYNRVATIHFPFLKELHHAKDRAYGVKVRKRDIDIYRTLFNEIIFGDFGLTEASGFMMEKGTLSQTAPNFHVLVESYMVVKQALIDFYKPFKSIFTPINGVDDLEMSWKEGLDELEKYRTIIPVFPGNDGEVIGIDNCERKTLPARQESIASDRRESRQESAKRVEKMDIMKPMTWAEIQERKREMASQARNSRDDRDRFGRSRRGGRDVPRGPDIDLYGLDDKVTREEDERRQSHRYASPRYAREDRYRPMNRNELRYGRR